jgi:beta-glucuronidase
MTFKIYSMRFILFALFATFSINTLAQVRVEKSLNSTWFFALDPQKVGESQGWTETEFPSNQLDKVEVPHSFSVDKRYFFYTGAAWYFKKFDAELPSPNVRAFIKFDAVFYKTNIWLNGIKIGSHEGGYTPFQLDVTPYLKQKNTLTVQVDNSWDTTTIPGAKTRDTSYRANASQLYAWMNYGGITKPVSLSYHAEAYLDKMQVIAEPDLLKGNAKIVVKAFLNNLSPKTENKELNAVILFNGKKSTASFKVTQTFLLSNTKQEILLSAYLPAKEVKLWSNDSPNLYQLILSLDQDTLKTNFGIRKIEVLGTKILLNGESIKMGGANRPADYPGFGSLDPDSLLFKDLTLMKSAGMELCRIAHHAVPEKLLDWADKNGMLIITEAGNWQMTTQQMADSSMREKYKLQLKEMVERDWNHPSVIAYSLGNEFYSHKKEGIDWVKDMKAYVKKLDNSRLVTFASYMAFRDFIQKPEDEASNYVDFISANVYGNHARALSKINSIYPNKPIYISEFGMMLNVSNSEEKRKTYFKNAFKAIREADYVVGASVWSFNDYLSRYPQSNPDGYRSWGVVSPERKPREIYATLQKEFSPAIITTENKTEHSLQLKISCRKDFPSYALKSYQIKYGTQIIKLKDLKPGESQIVNLMLSDVKYVELLKPGGFVCLIEVL